MFEDALNVSASDIEDCEARLIFKDFSFDTPLKETEGGKTFLDVTASKDPAVNDQVESAVYGTDILNAVEYAMADMNEKEQAIVVHRILADEPKTLESLGKDHGVCRERMRQLEMRVKQKLADWMPEDLAA